MSGPPDHQFQLSGRVVLLTGAGGHLGKSIARGLCAAGAVTVLSGRLQEPLDELAAELTMNGYDSKVETCDVRSAADRTNLLTRIELEFGRLDAVINNAYGGTGGSTRTATAADFAASYEIAVTSAFSALVMHPWAGSGGCAAG